MPVKVSQEYIEAARRHGDENPDDEARVHEAYITGLRLSDEAAQSIVDRGAPAVAHHLYNDKNAAEQIRSLPTQGQNAAIARLHSKLTGKKNANEDTDKYLAERTAGSKGGR